MITRQRAILNFLDELSSVNMHGFRLSLRGQVLAEGYWAPFVPDEPHRLYSVSKSVTSLAIGMLADDGLLRLDDPITAYFPEWVDDKTPAMLQEVTIRRMLMMATCYDRSMYSVEMDDWTRPFFHGKPTHPAGTLFNYDTSASQVMCALVEKLTHRDILSFMEERLFLPLGMTGPKRWLKDRAGTSQGGTGLLMTLRDFSLLADFCISDGRGLISQEYLRAATSRQILTCERTAPEEKYGYGYQFWQMRRGFAMYGLAGQMAMCLPEEGLTLCTTANTMPTTTGVQPLFDAFFRHLEHIADLPDDPADASELSARLASLSCPPVQDVQPMERALRVDLVETECAFSAVEITPCSVTFHLNGQAYTLPYAVGGWAKGVFPATTEKCISSGGWLSKDRFILRCEVKDTFINGMELHVCLTGERASVRLVGTLWELAPGWSGLGWGYTRPCQP